MNRHNSHNGRSYAELYGVCAKQQTMLKDAQAKLIEAATTINELTANNSILKLQIELMRKRLAEAGISTTDEVSKDG